MHDATADAVTSANTAAAATNAVEQSCIRATEASEWSTVPSHSVAQILYSTFFDHWPSGSKCWLTSGKIR